MNKERLYVFCYSHEGFNDYMRMNEWYDEPGKDTATISICSPNDEDPIHWFPDEPMCGNINIDFDDIDPSMNWKDDAYDRLLDEYIKYDHDVDDSEYKFKSPTAQTGYVTAMTYKDAQKIVFFIDMQIRSGIKYFIIHCSAGISRSQAIVKYIQDTYSDKYKIITRDNNPCLTPNYHVVRMLKRIKNLPENRNT